MKRVGKVLISVLALSVLLTGCTTPQSAVVSDSQDIAVTSAAVITSVSEELPASTDPSQVDELRIISTVPSATEILFALGCGEMIVGVDESSTFPAQTADIEKIGDYNGFDVEKIISLEPDVVFVGYTIQDAQVEQLKNAGIHTASVEARGLADIPGSIITIGAEVGRGNEAEELVNTIDETIVSITEKASTFSDKPSVYYVMGFGEYGNWTSGEGSFINDMIEAAGGTCVTADAANAWIEYPMEDLILADPDILIVSSYIVVDDLKADPGYAELRAVKNGSVFSIDSDIAERPGPRVTEAMADIQEMIIDYIGE